MARTRGIYNFSANLEVKKNAPLDARAVVATVLELTLTTTWADSDNKIWLYDGIVVSVTENHGLYMLKNYDPVTEPTAYSDINNWERIDASAAHLDVVTNLESTDDNKALAASQGKVLADKIEEVKNSLSAVYRYKGSVATFEGLPTDAVAGDVYNVIAANGNIPAGTNYAFDGENWDALGGAIDLSGYYTKDEVDSAIEAATPTDELEVIQSDIEDIKGDLLVINGTEETSGSLANTLKVAKDYTDTLLTAFVEKEEGKLLISDEKLELVDTTAADLAALEERVESNEAKLEILNGNKDTNGSILNTVHSTIENYLTWNEI